MRLSVSVCALLVAAQASAQGVRVRVVDDQANAPIPGALLTLRHPGRLPVEHLTNPSGEWLLPAAAGTEYSVD